MNRNLKRVPTVMVAALTVALTLSPIAAADAQPGGSGVRGLRRAGAHRPRIVSELAKVPVAVAASNSPVLTTLAAALSGKLNPR